MLYFSNSQSLIQIERCPDISVKYDTKEESAVIISSGFYARYIKRCMDFILSLWASVVLLPLLLVLTVTGAIALKGNPFFIQLRPGKIDPETGREKIFKLIKFRTMTYKSDKNGKMLSDKQRVTRYGTFLRSTSLDELPELINIIKGDMSLVGPRPQLVKDMVFMSPRQRMRHRVLPGLTGLAQVNGRNMIDWETKLEYDLSYIGCITFIGDLKIILRTFIKIFNREEVLAEGKETAEDFGDYLLDSGKISEAAYRELEARAAELSEEGI